MILRDIHRTFPAHDYFKESNGVGQEALYKISKAYSLYDEEVSYCQGLSFLAAALLLHVSNDDNRFKRKRSMLVDAGGTSVLRPHQDHVRLRDEGSVQARIRRPPPALLSAAEAY